MTKLDVATVRIVPVKFGSILVYHGTHGLLRNLIFRNVLTACG